MTTKEPQRTEFPRVWIRTEPYHDDALAKGEVVSTDIANHYARRGSHWIEYVHNEEHAAAIAELERKLEIAKKLITRITRIPEKDEMYGASSFGQMMYLVECDDLLRHARKALAEIEGEK